MTTEDFAKIFYSNFTPQTDWGNLSEIAWMYEEGLFELNIINLVSNAKFLQRINKVMNHNSGYIRSGENYPHIALKSFGRDLLINNFEVSVSDIKYEQNLVGFKVDVVDRNLHYPIECGDTNSLKLEKYLQLYSTYKFIILPYPRLKDLKAFIFSANPKFLTYIQFKSEHLNKHRAKFR